MDKHIQSSTSDDRNKAQQRGSSVTREAIEQLLTFREQLIQETNGILFEDSAEVLRREREKRTRYLMQIATGNYDEDPYAEDIDTKEQP